MLFRTRTLFNMFYKNRKSYKMLNTITLFFCICNIYNRKVQTVFRISTQPSRLPKTEKPTIYKLCIRSVIAKHLIIGRLGNRRQLFILGYSQTIRGTIFLETGTRPCPGRELISFGTA